MSGGLKVVDHGYNALVARVFGFGHPTIAMGILEADAGKALEAKKPWPDDAKPEPGLRVIDVANWMEFGFTEADGTEVPARSFVRAWFDQAEPQERAELARLMRAVVAGMMTKEQILELMGLKAVGGIQLRIAAGIDPPNKPSTVARKGSSKPLIASGQLRSSVTFAVREKGR